MVTDVTDYCHAPEGDNIVNFTASLNGSDHKKRDKTFTLFT